MAKEIERKFLVNKLLFKPSSKGKPVHQIYLKRNQNDSIRIRIIGSKSFLTIKNTVSTMVRNEFEYEIPMNDAKEMIEIFKDLPSVEKIRYQELHDGNEWVVDEFLNKNSGLLMAEIELETTLTKFTRPEWLLDEVTDDPRYHNSNLAVISFSSWI